MFRTFLVTMSLLALVGMGGCDKRTRSHLDHWQPSPASEVTTLGVYQRDCDANVGAACYELGEAFARGVWVAQNAPQALVKFTRACELQYAGACKTAAEMLSEGRGVPKDEARATALFQMACDAGDPSCCQRTD